MSRRARLKIDKHNHFNDVTFEVYRSEEPSVNESDLLVMSVSDNLAIKERFRMIDELLTQNPETPYAYFSTRHFETQPEPVVVFGDVAVASEDLVFFEEDKEIEIGNAEQGLGDKRPVYMSYDYQAIPMLDDPVEESGKTYYGPPATGLKLPLNLQMRQDDETVRLHISYEPDETPYHYFYRIYAVDSDGNKSPWSKEMPFEILAQDVFFRIQRSKEEDVWDEAARSNMSEWFEDLLATDLPQNLLNLQVFPQNSKESKLVFDNPWMAYKNQKRTSYRYRLRAEDSTGGKTEWVYMEPIPLFIQPKEVLIRRKLHNGDTASETGTDAIDVFRLTESDVDATKNQLSLIDDQLSPNEVYSYTFFVTDIIGYKAIPFFAVSNHLSFTNIIVSGQTEQDQTMTEEDFISEFDYADELIEIGESEG